MYALLVIHTCAETRMLLQPNHLMLIGILPMGYHSKAIPNEVLEVRPVRTITHIVNRLRTASRSTRRPQATEPKEHLP